MPLRRFVLSAALSAFALLPAIAAAQTPVQTAPPATNELGVKAGLNLSTLKLSSDDEDFSQRQGLVAGVFFGRTIRKGLGVQVEALVSQRGAKIKSDDVDIKLMYLEVPVFARFGVSSDNGNRFNAYAGPSFARLIDSELKVGSAAESLDDDVEAFDFGWAFGVSFEVRRVIVDARYTLGSSNIDKSGDLGTDTLKNRTVAIMFGYRFK